MATAGNIVAISPERVRADTLGYCYNEMGWRFTLLNGKRPIRSGWQREEPLPLEQVLAHPGNIGLRTGQVSGGIVVVDIDAGANLEGLEFTPTVTVRTGSGGRHLYYSHTGQLGNKPLQEHIDIRADGGQVVFPGSTHPDTGGLYEFEYSPMEYELAPLPAWIVDKLTERPAKRSNGNGTAGNVSNYITVAFSNELTAVYNATDGERNMRLNSAAFAAGQLISGGLSRGLAESQLQAAAEAVGLSKSEARATIKSGLDSGERNPREIPTNGKAPACKVRAHLEHTDTGDAIIVPDPAPMRLAESFIETHHYTRTKDLTLRSYKCEWYRATGPAYELEQPESIRVRIYNHLDRVLVPVEDKQGNQSLVKLRLHSRKVNEVLDAMPACGPLVDGNAPSWLDGEADKRPPADEFISCANGLLHLPTLELHSHTPRLFTTAALPFAYDPAAKCPEFESFLTSVWDDDLDAIQTLREWFGYCLFNDTRYQKMMLLVGPKRSGKGTIARVLAALLGPDNVCSPTLSGLTNHFGLQVLLNKTLAIIGDARLSGRTDQAAIAERLLSISGADHQTISRKHQADWTGYLSTKFMLLTNELPRMADASGALASRFIVLPMERSFYGHEDHDLFERLSGELPGIFNWAIRGAAELRDRGRFEQPACGLDAVTELEELSSPITAFINDRCEIGAAYSCTSKRLYTAWCEWCEENGRDHPGTAASFGRDLHTALPGIKRTNRRSGANERERAYEGVALK